ncbi:hypothetical protein D3C77_595350 [compost metagenome]
MVVVVEHEEVRCKNETGVGVLRAIGVVPSCECFQFITQITDEAALEGKRQVLWHCHLHRLDDLTDQ